jgi:hypothetical protein
MPLSQEAASVEPDLKEFADLEEEFEKYVGTLKIERETKAQVSEYVHQVQAALAKQVTLDPKQLAAWFPKADSAVLEDGVKLTVTQGKKTTSVSLLKLEPEPYYAVVKEVGLAVSKLLEEAEAQRGSEVIPKLQAFTRQTGRKVGVFDWRNYELILANTGGRAVAMAVEISAEGKWNYGPIDVNSMETTVIDLHDFSRIEHSKSLKIDLRCEDQDGRVYTGRVELQPNTKSVRVFELKPIPAPATS